MNGRGWWPAAAVAAAYVAAALPTFASDRRAEVAIIADAAGTRRERLTAERRVMETRGPLGVTVIEMEGRRVRVASSPCPNHLCVRRGWLTTAGDEAVCLPNRVAVRLE